MSKRNREHEDQDDISILDPAVQAVIEGYEGNLAQFMDSLTSLLGRYNGLLQAALPHNPKAVFYYQESQGGADPAVAAAVGAVAPTEGSDNAVAAKSAASPISTTPAPNPGEASLRRAPTSPLLRRPQLPPQQLEDLKLEAKAELDRRTSTFSFPTAAELAQSHKDKDHHHVPPSPDLKHSSARSNSLSNAPSVGITAASGATPDKDQKVAANGSATPAPQNPLGIRTVLNKVLDKKATKEAAKKAVEASTTAATNPTEATPSSEQGKSVPEETDNANSTEPLTVTQEILTRTVAEVLQDVAMPPMLLAQLRILKKESQALMYTFDQIHDWIAMKAPAMNEADNQGVAIMASVISVISSIMSSLQDLYDMEKEFITKRGQLEVQYVPNFECSTIKDLILALDANKWDDIEVGWRTMMRAVIIVHSRLASNMKTLRTPKERRLHHMSL